MATRRGTSALPWVLPEQCEGCMDCVGACPRQALVTVEAREGVFVPWLDDVDRCNGCGRCEAACTWGAISLTSYVGMARERLATRRPGGRVPVEESTPAVE